MSIDTLTPLKETNLVSLAMQLQKDYHNIHHRGINPSLQLQGHLEDSHVGQSAGKR